ncbi:MAG: Lrp/AsnC family transcriptional regulator, partial [Gammaproteobacteria bacterium]|nr:Lrp/AsnC family transcriptional regulator [Gammaproteobacteria bacterium]
MLQTELDRLDRAILLELQRDGRLSNVALAVRVNLSESACLRRVKILEENKVIDRYATLLNQAAVGLPDSVFVEISMTREQQEDLDAFEQAVRQLPEVLECYLMSGEYDYLLRVVVANTADYER